MQNPMDILGNPKTRGDFRRVNESVQQQQQDEQSRRERLDDVWVAIAEAYGSSFTSQFGEEPNQTWADSLSRFAMPEILAAVGRVIDKGSDYAPNLASVMAVLNETQAPNQHLMSRSLEDIRNTPITDKGEGRLELPDPNTPDIPLFDFKALWESA